MKIEPRNTVIFAMGVMSLVVFATSLFSPTLRADEGTAKGNEPLAVSAANRPFPVPHTPPPKFNPADFQFTDVGAKIPNYTPGARWGTQGDLKTQMQKPLRAEQSIGTYSLPDGFRLALWVQESAEHWPADKQSHSTAAGLRGKPIAMSWDERGRLWLCETLDYPNELQPSGQGRDRIRICEDTDGDGMADKFTVFAQRLSIPSTVLCYRGGALVQDGRSTIYLKDIDGDDVADFRQELITGWAMGDTHGGVSNFQYGPDNWIWGMQGYNNSEPVIQGQPQMRFRQGFWRFKVKPAAADTHAPAHAIDKTTQDVVQEPSSKFDKHTLGVQALEFVRATNNNTWGLGFSEEGYVFGSTANGCPSVHMPIPNRYYDQVAGWSAKTLERISPNFNFRPIDREIRQVDYHGGYTAAAGHAIYTARNYPEAWWNRVALVCEPTGHLVGGFVLEKSGADYKSANLFNVVASIDDWVAPIMSEVGPDGNVWVLDWYNYVVQHNPTPNGFRTGKGAAYESDLRDKRFGRIYRLLYQSQSQDGVATSSRRLDNASNDQLLAALSDKNFFWRRTAQRLLVERQAADPSTLQALVSLVDDQAVDAIGLTPSAMHAIWTLAGLADNGSAEAGHALRSACEKGFSHASSPVRAAAIQWSSPDQLEIVLSKKLHQDADPRVRLAFLLRSASQRSNNPITGAILASLVASDKAVGSDNVLLDAWTSAASLQPITTMVAVLNSGPGGTPDPRLASRIAILAEHVARSNPRASDVENLLAIDPQSPLSVSVWEGLAKGWPKNLTLTLSEASQQKLCDRFLADETPISSRAALLSVADKWSIANLENIVTKTQDRLIESALDPKQDGESRLAAWEQAIRIAPTSPRLIKAVELLFSPQLEPQVGSRAIQSLREARVVGLSKSMLQLRSRSSPGLAADIVTWMLYRADTTNELLDAIRANELHISDLPLDQRQALLNHPDRSIAERVSELMKQGGALIRSNRQALVDEWLPVTRLPGDLNNGIAMYKKHCGQCHRHGDLGTSIGPNLTGMAVHPKEEILVNVLDPSRNVENNFRTYQILTTDGRTLSGMLAGESSNALRLINSQGKEEQVLREDIQTMKASTKSLMPEGFEGSISKQEMADLLVFLNHRGRYTPLSLSGAATHSTARNLPGFRGSQGDMFSLKSYGKLDFDGIPFEIDEPQGGRVPNIIALQGQRPRGPGPGGRPPQAGSPLPSSVSIACSGKVSALHFLGGVASGAFPMNPNPSNSLIVRIVFRDGTTSDHPLVNGKHIVSYQGRTDVPESKFAFEAEGKQVRYLKVDVEGSKEIKSIDFVKGDDFSLPLVFAVTVESADSP